MIDARPLSFDDLKTRIQWMNDPRISSSMNFEVPIHLDATLAWYRRITTSSERTDVSFYSSAISHTKPIAMGGLTGISKIHKRAELYVFVDPDHHSQGFGTSAVEWLCSEGFSKFSLNRIYLHTMTSNERSRDLYSKMGFVMEGRLREHIIHHGISVDRFVQGLLRRDWLLNKKSPSNAGS